MARTPTYLRVNGDELKSLDAAATRDKAHAAGMLLLVEDARKGAGVPEEWMQLADKVVIGAMVVKDRDGNAAAE